MEARFTSDIAYLREAVSDFVRRDARSAALDVKVERLSAELAESRSRIRELEVFQSIAKGVLSGIGAAVVIVFIVAVIKSAASNHSDDITASEHADATTTQGPEELHQER